LLPVPRPVVLCADDFGVTEGVSRGIVKLARMGRLSATSVMAHRPWWPRLAPHLKELNGQVGVGLHLTLTLGEPLGAMPSFAPGGTFPPFRHLVRAAVSGRLPLHEISAEIDRQLAAFEAGFARPPDFVDGHQHVHVLPGIRRALLRVLQGRGLRGRVWLRDPCDHAFAILARRIAVTKALAVKGFAVGFATGARQAGFATNEGFSGFSPFDPKRDTGHEFRRTFAHLGRRPVVMCHPGHVDAELRTLDPAVDTRQREYDYLSSDEFGAFLEAEAIRLVPSPLFAEPQKTMAP
jgi:chitin disaccharide deacetylase